LIDLKKMDGFNLVKLLVLRFMLPILLRVWHLKYIIRVQILRKKRVPGFQHKFLGLHFTLEAKNIACEISDSK
jgi:hypothetical protein